MDVATQLDAEARRGSRRGPLHGIPVGVKDQFLVADMPCRVANTWGRTGTSTSDAGAVAKLREAGAIVIGTTYMPDRFGMAPTRNPWNAEYSPGASSSGSAAAVGGRLVPLTLGESTGGSGIRPPAFCGVAAIKPTYGRASRRGLYPISWSLDHPTVIAQSFEDLALGYNAVAGYDPDDATSAQVPLDPVSLELLEPPRIGFVRNHFPDEASEAMNDRMEKTARQLAEAGAVVVDVELDADFDVIWDVWTLIVAAERAAFHSQHSAQLDAVAPTLGELVPASFYLHAQRLRKPLTDMALRALRDVDVLLTPAATGPAPLGDAGGDNVMNSPWATTGLPSATFNIGLDDETGLPLGAQIAARPFCEQTLLGAGAWCESVIGRLSAPSPLALPSHHSEPNRK